MTVHAGHTLIIAGMPQGRHVSSNTPSCEQLEAALLALCPVLFLCTFPPFKQLLRAVCCVLLGGAGTLVSCT
jgi:hypothetical protein